MATAITSFETQHADMIHDAQMDYYAKRLATCSSDTVIKIFEVLNDTQTHLVDLLGHEGPVWQVAWSHPKFGSILASCGYDRKVIIWREQEGMKNQWSKIYVYSGHELSVNSICWAPHEYGLLLACASSDGFVSLLSQNNDGSWTTEKFAAHKLGVNAVSWAPASAPASLFNANTKPEPMRIVTGGCDNKVKIWAADLSTSTPSIQPQTAANNSSRWQLETTLEAHSDWVRDVQWAPNIGLPSNTIASASQDGSVIIWTQDVNDQGKSPWTKRPIEPKFGETVWRVSWSLTGNILAVSSGDSRVTLWKESLDHQWKCISSQAE